MSKKFMDRFINWFMERFIPVVVMILTVFVIGLIGFLCYDVIDENRQNSKAKAVFYFCDTCYYIDSYTIKDDEIIAIDVQGESMIFPRDCTIIKNKGE